MHEGVKIGVPAGSRNEDPTETELCNMHNVFALWPGSQLY